METTLLQLESNRWSKVREVRGGMGFQKKLENLGIRVGVRILKVSQTPGPIIVKVGSSQFAIGRGMASKIIVEG
ncbi:MAG: ferrous iron transport protein A [Candidatus Omnitrophica bacterium]|nr:ferrous iron transport protein A [Candidatus Omnitrophota bacterium]